MCSLIYSRPAAAATTNDDGDYVRPVMKSPHCYA